MNIYRQNVSCLCRSCLVELDQMAEKCDMNDHLYLQDMFFVATSLPALGRDASLPRLLCVICCTKLKEFGKFRDMMLHSHRILSDMLNLSLEIECNNNTRRKDGHIHENGEWLQKAGAENIYERQVDHSMENMEIIEVEIKDEFPFDDIIVEDEEEEEYVSNELEGGINVDATTSSILLNESVENYQTIDVSSAHTQTLEQANKNNKGQSKNCTKYFCSDCPYRWFLSQANLDAHKRTHKGLKPFACNKCDRSFNLSTQLRLHMREDHSKNPTKIDCPYEGCAKWFTKSGSLKTHMRNKHGRYTPYICEDCGLVYNNSLAFREHRYKHKSVDEYPFKCEQCDKRFAAKSRYLRHLVRHTGIKSFECPHCDMRKYTRDELNAHLNTHTKAKQWSCKFCAKVFTTSTNWRIHEQTVHKGIRKFNCQYCDQTFGRPHTRRRHEMTHTGERPFACQVCDKRFIQAATLATHLKSHKVPTT